MNRLKNHGFQIKFSNKSLKEKPILKMPYSIVKQDQGLIALVLPFCKDIKSCFAKNCLKICRNSP